MKAGDLIKFLNSCTGYTDILNPQHPQLFGSPHYIDAGDTALITAINESQTMVKVLIGGIILNNIMIHDLELLTASSV